jgi:hypothetical protein
MISTISSIGGFLFGLYAIYRGYKLVIRPFMKWVNQKLIKPIVVGYIDLLDRWQYSDYRQLYLIYMALGTYLVKSCLILGSSFLILLPCLMAFEAYQYFWIFLLYVVAACLTTWKIMTFKILERLSKAYCTS